jgi:hypothetical protein
MKTIPLSRRSTRSINTKSERNHKEPHTMANDTDNNFLVTGATQNANIATDYSVGDASHFQVVKVSFGDVGVGGTRVTSSVGLPVDVVSSAAINVTSIANPVTVSGSMAVYGINGATAIAVTASNFGIRALTAGDPTAATAAFSADFVRVVGYSGGWAVGVTATNFGIRALTAGNITSGITQAGADYVRVVGASGAYPIAVTTVAGASFDIRGLTWTKDSVSVLNTVSVTNDSTSDPYDPTKSGKGFQTRILRASTGSDPTTSQGALNAVLNSVEDTVRVVGLSGAYPISTVVHGLTSSTNLNSRIPLRVDDNGNLYVNLAAGTIGVTAQISGADFRLTGICLASATAAAMTIQVNGYTGPGAIAIGVTATNFDIRDLSSATDSVYAQTRVLSGACGDEVGITGSAWTIIEKFNSAITSPEGGNRLRTDDANGTDIKNGVNALGNTLSSIDGKISTDTTLGGGIKVSVVGVAQPTGITSGKVAASASPTATQLGNFALKSGIHIKSDLVNTTSTVFVGYDSVSTNGYALFNGDQIFIETDNTNKIWISASTAGSTVYYIGT